MLTSMLPRKLRGSSRYALPRWQAARAACVAGIRNARILAFGDSTTAGYGALDATFGANGITGSYPTALAGLVTAGSWQSTFGDHNFGKAGAVSFDTRLTVPTGWVSATGGGARAMCAAPWWSDTPSTDAWEFLPTTSVDTFESYYSEYSGGGVLSWAVDGGSATNIDTNNAVTSAKKVTVSAGAAGAHALKIRRVSGGLVVFNGAIGYNSAVKEITVINGGWSAATALDLATAQTAGSLEMVRLIAPDLMILMLMINDAHLGTSLSSFRASVLSIIASARISGDVLILAGIASNPTTYTPIAVQQLYIEELADIAAQEHFPFESFTKRLGHWESLNGAGEMRDDAHGTSALYSRMAGVVAQYVNR